MAPKKIQKVSRPMGTEKSILDGLYPYCSLHFLGKSPNYLIWDRFMDHFCILSIDVKIIDFSNPLHRREDTSFSFIPIQSSTYLS
jgi:hypothetical protein